MQTRSLSEPLQQYVHDQEHEPRITFTSSEFEGNSNVVAETINRIDWPSNEIAVRWTDENKIAISPNVWPTSDVAVLPQHALIHEKDLVNYAQYNHCGTQGPIKQKIQVIREDLGVRVYQYGAGLEKVDKSLDDLGNDSNRTYTRVLYHDREMFGANRAMTPHDADILLALTLALESPQIQQRSRESGKPFYFTYSVENDHTRLVAAVYDSKNKAWVVCSDNIVSDSLMNSGILPGISIPIVNFRRTDSGQEADNRYYRQLALATPEYRAYLERLARERIRNVNECLNVELDPEDLINARDGDASKYTQFFQEFIEVARPEVMGLAADCLAKLKAKKAEVTQWREDHPEELQKLEAEMDVYTADKERTSNQFAQAEGEINAELQSLGMMLAHNEKELNQCRARSIHLSSTLPEELRRSRKVWERLERSDIVANIDVNLAKFEADPELEARMKSELDELKKQDAELFQENKRLHALIVEKRQAVSLRRHENDQQISRVNNLMMDVNQRIHLSDPEYWQRFVDYLESSYAGNSIVAAKPSLISQLGATFERLQFNLDRKPFKYREEVLDIVENSVVPISHLIGLIENSGIIELTPNQKLICSLLLPFQRAILGEDTSLAALMSGPKDYPGILWEMIRCQQVDEHPIYKAILQYGGLDTSLGDDPREIRKKVYEQSDRIKDVVHGTVAKMFENTGLLACHVNLPATIKYSVSM